MVLAQWLRRRRFRRRVRELMDPFFGAMTEPALAQFASQYRAREALVDEMCAEGVSPEQTAAYGLSATLTNFIAEVDGTRRADVLSQVERYAQAATLGQAASAMPTDELALLVLAVEDQVQQWAEQGLATSVEADIVLSELIGALRGASPSDRTMGRFMDFLDLVGERNRDAPS